MAERKIDFRVTAKDDASGVFAKIEDSLKRMRKSSSSQAFEEVGKLLRGGGVIGGFLLGARAIGDFAKSWERLSEAERDGAVAMSGIEKAVRSLPIFSDFAEAMDQIKLSASGVGDEIARINREAKQIEKSVATTRAAVLAGQSVLSGIRDAAASSNLANMSLPWNTGAGLAMGKNWGMGTSSGKNIEIANVVQNLEQEMAGLAKLRKSVDELPSDVPRSTVIAAKMELDKLEASILERNRSAMKTTEKKWADLETAVKEDMAGNIERMQQQIEESSLAAAGDQLGAAVLGIEHELENATASLEKQRGELQQKFPQLGVIIAQRVDEMIGLMQEKALVQTGAVQGRFAEAEAEKKRRGEVENEERILSIKEEIARMEGVAASESRRVELDKLAIVERTARVQRELMAAADSVSGPQKAALLANAIALGGAAAGALERMNESSAPTFSGGTAPLVTGRRLSGLAVAAAANDPFQQAVEKATKDQTQELKDFWTSQLPKSISDFAAKLKDGAIQLIPAKLKK